MLPVTRTNTKDFKILTTKASLNPNIINVTKITILDKPSLAPGIKIGKGIADSKTDKARPIATNRDKNIILFDLFIYLSS